MVEYYVLSDKDDAFMTAVWLQVRLNELAEEGWYVICYCPVGIILEREKQDKGEELAEDILRRQYTLSLGEY